MFSFKKLVSLFFKERCELRSDRSPKKSDCEQIPHQKWATVSDSLTKNVRMSELLFFWANRSFALFLTKNEQFGKITDEVIPIPRNHNNILSLKPKIDPPYCTKVYATTVYTNLVYNKSACTWRTVTQS